MRASSPGASGARRRSRRDTPRPADVARHRGAARRASGAEEPHDRHFGRNNRPQRGYRFPNGDQARVAAHRDSAPLVARSSAEVAQPLAPSPSRPVRTWLLWLAAGMVVVALVGGGTWVLLVSSVFDARIVAVAGTKELPADVVRAVAAVPLGTPMLRLDTTAIERRVAAVPRVASVQVRCSVDGTVRIELAERIPVAIVRRDNGVHLVDATGTDYAAVPVGPPGLPELRSDRVGPRDAATVAALTVLTGLPEWLRAQVRSIAANSPAAVVLRLDSGRLSTGRSGTGREVRWGGVEDSARKVAVLSPLLSQPGKVYDISSPALPTIA